MAVEQLLNIPQTALFLLAPPAWGKTYRLREWFENSAHKLLIYISPLRALADEVEESFQQFSLLNLRSSRALEEFYGKKRVLVITPEKVNGELLAWIQTQEKYMLFFDEFHLYDHWSSFRPQMLEALFSLASLGAPTMLVTATLAKESIEYWSFYFSLNYKYLYMIDVGNYRLKNYPVGWHRWFGDYHYYLLMLLWRQRFRKRKRTVLCFCPYRHEVIELYREFKRNGFSTLYCIGGETTTFRAELKKVPCPELIVSTIALSHGVNLPDLSSIFFTYRETNRDYFTQMVARAGRKGERYSVWIPGKLSLPQLF